MEHYHQALPSTSMCHHGVVVAIISPFMTLTYGLTSEDNDIVGTRNNSLAAMREEPTSTTERQSLAGHSSQSTPGPAGPDGPRWAYKALIAVLQ
jgi:hypothetical protein